MIPKQENSYSIVFMGTPDFAVPTLKLLVETFPGEVKKVFTQPDSIAGRGRKLKAPQVKIAAENLGIPVFQPGRLSEASSIQKLEEISPDLIVVVAYAQKVPRKVLDMPPHGCINLHPSLLPKYRGASPIRHTLMNGETITGNTSMYLNEEWDAGDIILQQEVEIKPNETYGELIPRMAKLGAELMVETVKKIKLNNAPRIPQDHSKATFAPAITNEICEIDWNLPTERILNLVRGLSPVPGAYCRYNEKRLKILKGEKIQPAAPLGEPGTIIAADKHQGLIVSGGDGAINIAVLQPEGKKAMTGHQFVNGYRPEKGENFNN